MAISLLLSLTVGMAQTNNKKSESLKIYGNCAMCEKTIEKAGSLNKEATVDWNKDTKIAIIAYDSLATSKEEILKRIALVGYDSDFFFAPDDTYSNLPECCQYERAKKDVHNMEAHDMKIANDHSHHGAMTQASQDKNALSSVFENYFAVKDALIKTDGALASTLVENLLKSVTEVQMDKLPMDVHMVWMKVLKNLREDLAGMVATKDIGKQRDYFISLSKNMYDVIKVSKSQAPVYYQFCPMANGGKGANWLSKDEVIKNPYYGSQMLSCGSTVETIN